MHGTAQAPDGATALQEAAAALDVAARSHKRAEAFHRRQAREARRSLADLEATCRSLGIRLVIHHGHSPEDGS